MKNKNKIKSLFIFIIFFFFLFYIKNEKGSYQSVVYNYNGNEVKIVFHGEKKNGDVFKKNQNLTDIVYPQNESGERVGEIFESDNSWLNFSYLVNDKRKDLLISKTPIMNFVSWEDIARGGMALGDDSDVLIDDISYPQNATIRDKNGNLYRVRLLTCGQGTLDNFSEWNLLIGGVHKGDVDFNNEDFNGIFGWIKEPYSDRDLSVGLDGSLSWCMDEWEEVPNYKVLRGYFFVSRWHAGLKTLSTDRIFWRPVLELVESQNHDFVEPSINLGNLKEEKDDDSFQKSVNFYGEIESSDLFKEGFEIAKHFNFSLGKYVDENSPNWLHFRIDEKELLVAKRPIKYAVSWEDIAKLGMALGDDSKVVIKGVSYPQSATVADKNGNLYRVRLLSCGEKMLDNLSEWNLLIGGVHKGDYNFNSSRDEIFSRFYPLYDDSDIYTGFLDRDSGGIANWCKETQTIKNSRYSVNRGFLVVSRFHLTESSFRGVGFGWRPVLELVK
jgi:hypothetical protein